MRVKYLFILLVFITAAAFGGRSSVRFGEWFDPGRQLRIVVMPAEINTRIRGVESRTISALLATELLRRYDVLDLAGFEQFLADNRLTLEQAFSAKGRDLVRDSTAVNAVAGCEIYQWDAGEPGFWFLGEPAKLGVRVRLSDAFTGRIIWSTNRIAKSPGGTAPAEAITRVMTEIVDDLHHDIRKETERLRREALKREDEQHKRMAREEVREETRTVQAEKISEKRSMETIPSEEETTKPPADSIDAEEKMEMEKLTEPATTPEKPSPEEEKVSAPGDTSAIVDSLQVQPDSTEMKTEAAGTEEEEEKTGESPVDE